MQPGKYDLALYRGDSYKRKFRMWADKAKTIPVDLDGCTVAAEIRDKPGGTVIITMTCTVELPQTVAVEVTPAMWATAPAGAGSWDLEVVFANGEVNTPMAGKVVVTADVTHSTAAAGTFAVAEGTPVVRRTATLKSA